MTNTPMVDLSIETRRSAKRLGAGSLLPLAAAPTFAAMALLTAASEGNAANILCMGMANAGPLSGMTAMYLLMAVFHVTPWLRLMAKRQRS